jgi:hypothetical protein
MRSSTASPGTSTSSLVAGTEEATGGCIVERVPGGVLTAVDVPLAERLLTGADDRAFCAKSGGAPS